MKIFKKYIVLVIVVLGINGCDTFLEPIDDNHLGEDRINYDPAFAEGVLLNAYQSLIPAHNFIDVGTDDAVTNNLNSGFRRMAVGELSAQYIPASRWDNYEDIFYINKFIPTIENVQWKRNENVNEMFKQRMLGEALALRALHHFYILQAHAGRSTSGELLGIPYFDEFIASDGDFNIPRLSFTETIDLINRDFNEALNILPMDYTAVDDITEVPAGFEDADLESYKFVFGSANNLRISSRIIKAYQAKLALFAASPLFLDGSGNFYQEAADLSSELIQDIGGVAGLDPNGVEFYDEDSDKDLPELLWRGSIGQASWLEEAHYPPSLFGEGTVNPSWNLIEAFPMENGYPITDPASGYDSNDPYAGRDPRLAAYILYNGNQLGDRTINTGFGAGIDRVDSIQGTSTRTGFYLKKMLRPDVVINADGTTTPRQRFNTYLRYTDIFLVFAEAANELGGPDQAINGITARDVIAAIRERAGITQPDEYLATITSQEDMRELIRNERRLELCFEGHRFWDMRRWNLDLNEDIMGTFHNQGDYSIFEVEIRDYNDVTLPIPQDEIIKFNELVQNANW